MLDLLEGNFQSSLYLSADGRVAYITRNRCVTAVLNDNTLIRDLRSNKSYLLIVYTVELG